MRKRVLSILLSVSLLLMAGCGEETVSNSSSKWVDSDIKGVITADTEVSVKDDFAAYVNKDTYVLGELDGVAVTNISRKVTERKREIIEDVTCTGKGIEEVRKYVELAQNWDDRNKLGVAPLEPYINDIEGISSCDELYGFISDSKRNPLRYAPIEINGYARSLANPDVYMVDLRKSTFLLDNSDSYFSIDKTSLEKMVSIEERVTYILSKFGYTNEQIKHLLDKAYQFEKKVSERMELFDIKSAETYTLDEIAYMQGDYPLTSYLTNNGFGECNLFSTDADYLKQIDNLCRKNLEGVKAMCLVKYCLAAAPYLDYETAMYCEEMAKEKGTTSIMPDLRTDEQKAEDRIFDDIAKTSLEGALDIAYVDKYMDESSYDRLYKMTEDLIDAFRYIFSNEDWLSEEGKKECLEKLDAIEIHIVRPDEGDFSDLNIIPYSEGGSFLEAKFEVYRFESVKRGQEAASPVDRSSWSPYESQLSTTITNACYHPLMNGIYIFAGIIDDPVYTSDMTYEEMLGGIGAIVGHEITHGFDAGGVKYDKDGIENTWLPEKDRKAFSDRTSKVIMYYTLLKPFPSATTYSGELVNREATADMGGIKACLYLASKEKDFDYDIFFRHHAKMWAAQVNEDYEQARLEQDPHPLSFLRVNVTLSQYDEFIKTYDLHEGDGMYVSPDKRIAVW